jgi:MFS family permease
MAHFKSATTTGVAPTFVVMGVLYFLYMMIGVFTVRLPAPGWAPAGYVGRQSDNRMITAHDVAVGDAIRTPQFWLLWAMLCLNVTAGISIIEQASPMIQEMFPGVIVPSAAAGFVGLLSLANMGGRFVWSSFSDTIGRKVTFAIFFALGCAVYLAIPAAGHARQVSFFVLAAFVAISIYGGGFATIPAYLRDMYGTMHVGAIHGRLLTAWSTAGVLGPLFVNQLRESQIAAGVPKADAYDESMHLMAGFLVVGFICNLFLRPVAERYHLRRSAAAPDGIPAGARS